MRKKLTTRSCGTSSLPDPRQRGPGQTNSKCRPGRGASPLPPRQATQPWLPPPMPMPPPFCSPSSMVPIPPAYQRLASPRRPPCCSTSAPRSRPSLTPRSPLSPAGLVSPPPFPSSPPVASSQHPGASSCPSLLWRLPLTAFAPLLRRYVRLGRPASTLCAFRFLRRHPERYTVEYGDGDDSSSGAAVSPLVLTVDTLCKEGHPRAAAQLIEQLRREEPGWAPDVRIYNILLNGWSRKRRLDKVQKLWAAMRDAGVRPTMVSYGTLIDALCVMHRPDQAVDLLDQMREEGIGANLLTCNPIVYALAQAGRFTDAHKVLEKFPLYGVAPNISTFNSLVLGYCKHGDLAGASGVLKAMLGRGISPTARTYNYFFMFFARNRSVELGMNLYNKMVNNGYEPDQLTYHLLIKLLCE
jgi:pentatricopeptide repeat protein